jgi:hypothetical protein
MATDTAPTSDTRRRPRQLWQLPVFLLGVAALVGVWHARPYLRPDPAARFAADLDELRKAVERPTPDVKTAIAVGQKLLPRVAEQPALAGETHFLLGSAYLFQSESAQGEAGRDALHTARVHLEEAGRAGVPEGDRPRLDYRLGKAWLKIGVNPEKAADYIRRSIDAAEDTAEAYRLLADALLAGSPPDRVGAIQALQKSLEQPGPTDNKLLTQIRLQIGELSQATEDAAVMADGRKALEKVGPDDPGAFLKARLRLAAVSAKTDPAGEALHLEKIRDHVLTKITPADRKAVMTRLGAVYVATNRDDDAVAAWSHPGVLPAPGEPADDAARTVALRLADLKIKKSELADAVTLVETAARGVTKPDEFHADGLTAAEARPTFERVAAACLEQGEYDLALKAAEAYAPLAEKGEDRKLAAAAAAGAARTLEAKAKSAAPEEAGRLKAEAAKQYRQAAIQARRWSEARTGAEQAEPLRRAAEWFRTAGDPKLAAEVLERLTALPGLTAEEAGAAHFERAEALRQLGQPTEAVAAYGFSAQRPGPHQARARLESARLKVEMALAERVAQHNDEAEGLLAAAAEDLKPNLDPQTMPEPAVHEASLYAYADVTYQRRDYVEAEPRLADALRLYPENPQAKVAAFRLGRCAYFEALKEYEASKPPSLPPETKAARLKRYRELLQKGADLFEKLGNEMQEKATASPLPPGEAVLWRQTSFAAAECYFFMASYQEAAQRNSILAARYKGQVEELVALSQLWQCQFYLAQREPALRDKAKATLERVRKAFQEMPDGAFDGSTPQHKREFWTRQLDEMDKSPAPPG